MDARFPALLPAVVLAACAYPEPAPDTPAAELIVVSNHEEDPFRSADSRTRNVFEVFADEQCDVRVGTLAGFPHNDAGPEKLMRISTGERLYVLAYWSNTAPGTGDEPRVHSCANLVSFVPQVGGRYVLHQAIRRDDGPFAAGAQCATLIRNAREYDPDRTFQEHRIGVGCR